MGVLSKIPTDNSGVCVAHRYHGSGLVAYMQYIQMTIVVQGFCAIMAGFIVDDAMYGWEKLSELWKRFLEKLDFK